jgi:hypothetical protein
MKLLKKIAIGIGALFVAGGILLIVFVSLLAHFLDGLPDPCGNEFIADSISPNQTQKAVIFERDCGSTTSFSTHVSILDRGTSLKDAGKSLFVADTNRGRAPSGPGGGPEIFVRWVSDNKLEIRHHRLARVIRADSRSKGINVTYETFQ